MQEFDVISDKAKNFISALLLRKQSRRLSVRDCLEHPWLKHHEDLDRNKVVLNTENHRKYLARRRWQRCGQAIRAMKRMSGLMLRKQSVDDEEITQDNYPPNYVSTYEWKIKSAASKKN